jgi:hypothetical protein
MGRYRETLAIHWATDVAGRWRSSSASPFSYGQGACERGTDLTGTDNGVLHKDSPVSERVLSIE